MYTNTCHTHQREEGIYTNTCHTYCTHYTSAQQTHACTYILAHFNNKWWVIPGELATYQFIQQVM